MNSGSVSHAWAADKLLYGPTLRTAVTLVMCIPRSRSGVEQFRPASVFPGSEFTTTCAGGS
jgi:hypothetical protein